MNELRMFLVRQQFADDKIDDIEAAVRSALSNGQIKVPSGARIALTVGSRGIANLERIVRAVVGSLVEMGAKPFIVPAMGSHGGATAEGQLEVLASYGITEDRVGAEICSSMETVELPGPGLANRVFMDRHAYESDGVILLNRSKPHTDFHGRWESGLAKMAVIGLGKQRLADEIHSFGIRGLKDLIAPTAEFVLRSGKILGAIGVAENAFDQTMAIEAVTADRVMETDSRLLELARANMPKLPVSEIDVLVIDVMGKDKSGTGVDTNIIGRISIRGEDEPAFPNISSIVITDLSEVSHGNAIGVGLGDVITRRLHDKIDFQSTYENSITSSFLDRCKIPLVAETDADALAVALRSAGCRTLRDSRIVRIRSTLELSEVLVSEALRSEIEGSDRAVIGSEPLPLLLPDGSLGPFPR